MCLELILSAVFSINLFGQNYVHCLPLQLLQVLANKDSEAAHEDIQTIERNTDEINFFTTNDKMLILKDDDEDFEDYPLSKRATPDQGLNNDNIVAKEILQSEKKASEGEGRASIPFLSKGESDSSDSSSSGSGLPSVPGISQIPGVSSAMSNTSGSGSNTPTLVMGGFSFVVMPMPGLSMSNIGSALQTGQQMSQFVPGMPSLPG